MPASIVLRCKAAGIECWFIGQQGPYSAAEFVEIVFGNDVRANSELQRKLHTNPICMSVLSLQGVRFHIPRIITMTGQVVTMLTGPLL